MGAQRVVAARLARWWVVCGVLLLLGGCGFAHTARPLGKGKSAVHMALGGPITEIGDATVPLPQVVITGKYGVTDRLDVYGSWHLLTSVMNRGNVAFDLGASYYLLDQRGGAPGLSASLTVHQIYNAQDAWFGIDTNIIASWLVRERHLFYVGASVFFAPIQAQNLSIPPVSFSPYLGAQVRVGRNRQVGIGFELKWLRPTTNMDNATVSFVAPGRQGAIATTLGLSFYLPEPGRRREEQDVQEEQQ